MRVLVTGGAGFIGSHVSRALIERGDSVRILDNLSTGRRSQVHPEADLWEADLRDPEAVRRAAAGMEAILHVAALPSVARSWNDPVTTLDVNFLGTANLLDAALAAGVERLVYSSSSSVYGDQVPERKAETVPPRPKSPYAHSKLAGEKLVLACDRRTAPRPSATTPADPTAAAGGHSTGLRAPGGTSTSHTAAGPLTTVALRYFNVFGPGQDPSSQYSAVIPLFIRHSLAGTEARIDGDGRQSRDFTYVENVVDANLRALAADTTGIAINTACGESYTLLQLVEAISRLAGSPLAVSHGPARPGDVRNSLADISRARSLLGYEPRVGFEEGLRRTYEWFRDAP